MTYAPPFAFPWKLQRHSITTQSTTLIPKSPKTGSVHAHLLLSHITSALPPLYNYRNSGQYMYISREGNTCKERVKNHGKRNVKLEKWKTMEKKMSKLYSLLSGKRCWLLILVSLKDFAPSGNGQTQYQQLLAQYFYKLFSAHMEGENWVDCLALCSWTWTVSSPGTGELPVCWLNCPWRLALTGRFLFPWPISETLRPLPFSPVLFWDPYVTSIPLVFTGPSLELFQLTDRNIFLRLQTLQSIKHEIWSKLSTLNVPGMPRPLTTSRLVNMSTKGGISTVAGLLLEGTLPGASKDVCPATHSVDQGELNIKYLPASASQVQGIKACTTTT